tara:strand:+ start:599 stop:1033 length:435 start_codon:yes stop_codon:yes gene_type:complete
MKIYTAHWKHYTDDYYAEYNRKMFTTRELADAFLTDLMDYEHIERYYVLEEEVYEEFIPSNDYCNEYNDDLYYDDADEFYSDPLEDYYSDLAMYKHEEISDMYNKHYHFSWGLGKNVMNTDSMWFTSDEIEAFREIWQRRISAL